MGGTRLRNGYRRDETFLRETQLHICGLRSKVSGCPVTEPNLCPTVLRVKGWGTCVVGITAGGRGL